MGEIIFYSVCFLLVVFLLFLLTWFWPPDSPWSFWWRTDKKIAKVIAKLANITKGDVVYELGSGDGEFVLWIARNTGAKVIGIEIDPFRYWVSRARISLNRSAQKKVILMKKNFFDVKLSSATVIYLYLVPRAIEKLLPKFKKELKKGTRVISYRYKIDLPLIAENKRHKIYVYKI